MRRSGPLARRTPLKRRADPGGGPLRVSAPAGVPPAVRRAVLARADGSCDVCGEALPDSYVHLHHRARRSQGGPHEAWNLLALHPVCHLVVVHGHVADAKACGWLLGAGWAPGDPVLLHGKVWAALDGSPVAHRDPAAEALAASLIVRWA